MSRRFGGLGCRYLVDDRLHQFGAQEKHGSSYCPGHHALCYLPPDSLLERRRIRQIDRIGEAIGGRQAGKNTAGALHKFMLKVAAIEGHA